MEILQINENCEIIKTWNSTKEIAENLKESETLQYQAFNQAIKKGFRSHGFYWMDKKDWDEGMRPDFEKPSRNIPIFAYKPTNELKRSEYNDITIPIEDYIFIGRFENAVMCAIYLNISVSNVRCVLHTDKRLHKGYYFSLTAINEEDNDTPYLAPSEIKIKTYRRNQRHYQRP